MLGSDTMLEDEIRRTVRESALADAVSRVRIVPASDGEGGEFLRVELTVHLPDRDVEADLESLVEQIEEVVSASDERYPSVRFLDAA